MYNNYVRALKALKNLLPDEAQSTFAIYEARLLENVHREQLFGSNPTDGTNRAMVIDGLNRLAKDYDVTSFNDLCYPDRASGIGSQPRSSATAAEPATSSQQAINKGIQISGGVFNAEQVAVGDQAQALKFAHFPPAASTPVIPSANAIGSSTSRTRNSAFISYSHHDSAYLQRLQTHLSYYIRADQIDVWDDTRIKAGSKWREEIEKALQVANVAVLLISADFLASDFIATNELPPLLTAAEIEGVTILPVIVSYSAFKHTELAQFQSVNPPSSPLVSQTHADQEALWSKVAERVRDVLKGPPNRP